MLWRKGLPFSTVLLNSPVTTTAVFLPFIECPRTCFSKGLGSCLAFPLPAPCAAVTRQAGGRAGASPSANASRAVKELLRKVCCLKTPTPPRTARGVLQAPKPAAVNRPGEFRWVYSRPGGTRTPVCQPRRAGSVATPVPFCVNQGLASHAYATSAGLHSVG